MDFLKDRVGVEVGFGHASFLGIDLLKFQVSSYSGLDQIDVGIYVTTTKSFQKNMRKDHNQNWEGSLTFEKVTRYLPAFKSAIQVPIYVLGIEDIAGIFQGSRLTSQGMRLKGGQDYGVSRKSLQVRLPD